MSILRCSGIAPILPANETAMKTVSLSTIGRQLRDLASLLRPMKSSLGTLVLT